MKTYTASLDDSGTIYDVSGELDISCAEEFSEMMGEVLEKFLLTGGNLLQIDLTKTHYLDSSILAVLFRVFKDITAASRKLLIIITQPSLIEKSFSVTKFDSVIDVKKVNVDEKETI